MARLTIEVDCGDGAFMSIADDYKVTALTISHTLLFL